MVWSGLPRPATRWWTGGGCGMAVGAGFEDAEGRAQRPCLVASGAELEGGGGAGVVAGHGSLHG